MVFSTMLIKVFFVVFVGASAEGTSACATTDSCVTTDDSSTPMSEHLVAPDPGQSLLQVQSHRRDPAATPDAATPMQNNVVPYVAIILRGQAFKSGKDGKPCDKNSVKVQLEATQSLMDKIVSPLETKGNHVHIFVTVGQTGCEFMPLYQNMLNLTRSLVSFKVFDSPDQAVTMRTAVQNFKKYSLGAKKYNLIMIARHDMLWKQPFDQWPTVDVGKFNFFSLCQLLQPSACVNDVFFMMCGSHFRAFDSILGKPCCFDSASGCGTKKGNGHGCYKYLASAIGEDQITFVTDWRPRGPNSTMRDPNPVGMLT